MKLARVFLPSFIIALMFFGLIVIDTAQNNNGVLWTAPLYANALMVQAIADINGDQHDDIVTITKSSTDGYIFLNDGKTGASISMLDIGHLPLEAIFLQGTQPRIAIAYSGNIQLYQINNGQLSAYGPPISKPRQPLSLSTFTGNELLFYYDSGGVLENSWTIESYSLDNLNRQYSYVVSGSPIGIFGLTRTLNDILVIDSNQVLALVCDTGYFAPNGWELILLNNKLSAHTTVSGFAGASNNEAITLSAYDSNHFLCTRQIGTTNRNLYLYQTNPNKVSMVWSKAVFMQNDNIALPTVDVNKDGQKEVLTRYNYNLAVLNGANGNYMYDLGAASVKSAKEVSDINGDGVNEVVFQSNQLYLVSLKQTGYTVVWQQNIVANDLAIIQDINSDGFKDVVAAAGSTLSCFIGAAPFTPTPTPSPKPTITPSPIPTLTPRPTVTATPSPTPTKTPTSTSTPTPSPEPTVNPTSTPTPPPTPVPTHTTAATVTPRPTANPTQQPIPTQTQTPTPDPTNNPTPTATPPPSETTTPAPLAPTPTQPTDRLNETSQIIVIAAIVVTIIVGGLVYFYKAKGEQTDLPEDYMPENDLPG